MTTVKKEGEDCELNGPNKGNPTLAARRKKEEKKKKKKRGPYGAKQQQYFPPHPFNRQGRDGCHDHAQSSNRDREISRDLWVGAVENAGRVEKHRVDSRNLLNDVEEGGNQHGLPVDPIHYQILGGEFFRPSATRGIHDLPKFLVQRLVCQVAPQSFQGNERVLLAAFHRKPLQKQRREQKA